jgi:hypothetical protein
MTYLRIVIPLQLGVWSVIPRVKPEGMLFGIMLWTRYRSRFHFIWETVQF